jgi:hypothetical protein
MDTKLDGLLLVGILIMKDNNKVTDQTKSLVQPRHILMDLKAKNKESLTNIKQVYDACCRLRRSERDDKSDHTLFIIT